MNLLERSRMARAEEPERYRAAEPSYFVTCKEAIFPHKIRDLRKSESARYFACYRYGEEKMLVSYCDK